MNFQESIYKDAFVGSGEGEVSSACKLSEQDDGFLVMEHGLDACGTTMEYDADAGTSSSVVNKDKASKKQISWESNNENFMKGQNWKNKKKFGNKRNNKFMNKNKKGKRN